MHGTNCSRFRLGQVRLLLTRNDSLGRRTAATLAGQVKGYLYDQDTLVQELPNGQSVVNLFASGRDAYINRTDLSGSRTYLLGMLGTVLSLTDDGGSSRTEYTYEPFGRSTLSGEATANELQFTDKENDGSTTGVYLFGSRYYDPVRQRFISEDPIGFGGGDINLYAYVSGDPIGSSDPTGQERCPQCEVRIHYRPAAGAPIGNHSYFYLRKNESEEILEAGPSRSPTNEEWGRWNYGRGPRHNFGLMVWGSYPGNSHGPSRASSDASLYRKDPSQEACTEYDCVHVVASGFPTNIKYWFLGPNSNTFAAHIAAVCGLRTGLWFAFIPGWYPLDSFRPR